MSVYFKLFLCVGCAALFLRIGSCQRIVGGRPATAGELPYQVSIRRSYSDEHFCGGSIITARHILTAAHCVFYSWGGLLPSIVVSVIVGQLELAVSETSIFRNASTITAHERFDPETFANDIAVIELDDELPVESNKLIAAISTREVSVSAGTCVVSGWGYEEHQAEVLSEVLLAAQVDIIEFSRCREMYAKEGTQLSEGMLCAGHEQGEKDACQGDSGGPLVCNGLLTGIVSTGSGCANANFPGIYTDVAKFLPWILDKIAETSNSRTGATSDISVSASSPTVTESRATGSSFAESTATTESSTSASSISDVTTDISATTTSLARRVLLSKSVVVIIIVVIFIALFG